MAKRKIIRIDEDKCDGCGLCVPSCAEGALAVIDGKARLVSETYCDGLGACLGECPRGAITVEERDAALFDSDAVADHLRNKFVQNSSHLSSISNIMPAHFSSCPGSHSQSLKQTSSSTQFSAPAAETEIPSQLGNWPVQIHLAPIKAPYFQNARLLIAADCVPFAFADFHNRFLEGRILLIGCPKLDDTDTYLNRLTAIIAENDILSIEIVYMEVPCCSGLVHLIKRALTDANKSILLTLHKIGIRGNYLSSENL
ncbi:4Fe-4S ferredoxin iron-sulfur binding domain protein [Candidatus Zixiibacteriota bacterium]|nr:4Fe-4S ferredoxin iron-sulfur binding domain protein [candidate division Zixibacteria bacterium]